MVENIAEINWKALYEKVEEEFNHAQKQVADQKAVIAQLQQKVARYQIAISELACQILVK